jgi:hypothetical protein
LKSIFCQVPRFSAPFEISLLRETPLSGFSCAQAYNRGLRMRAATDDPRTESPSSRIRDHNIRQRNSIGNRGRRACVPQENVQKANHELVQLRKLREDPVGDRIAAQGQRRSKIVF